MAPRAPRVFSNPLHIQIMSQEPVKEYFARNSGRTTKQIHEAPPGSLYIWCARDTSYLRALVNAYGRQDLEITNIDTLRYTADAHRVCQGRIFPFIVVDHAIHMGDTEFELLYIICAECIK